MVGLGVSAALLTGFVVSHPNWTATGVYGGFALLTGAYTAFRNVLKFRCRLSSAEPLPSECVEVAPRANEVTPRLLFELVVIAGVVLCSLGSRTSDGPPRSRPAWLRL